MPSSRTIRETGPDTERRPAPRVSSISQALRSLSADGSLAPRGNAPGSPVVRAVRGATELDQVHALSHDAYAERGYCRRRADGRLVHYPVFDHIKETIILIVEDQGRILGTVSLTRDGPAGLPVDGEFKTVCDAIRREGRTFGCWWRLATRNAHRNERQLVMRLVAASVLVAFGAWDCDTFLCAVNPRHEGFYRRLLKMRAVARSDGTGGLKNAPAVLMRSDVEAVPARWLRVRKINPLRESTGQVETNRASNEREIAHVQNATDF